MTPATAKAMIEAGERAALEAMPKLQALFASANGRSRAGNGNFHKTRR